MKLQTSAQAMGFNSFFSLGEAGLVDLPIDLEMLVLATRLVQCGSEVT